MFSRHHTLTWILVCEVTIQNKKGYVAVMYRCPSQSSIKFESFFSGFEDTLSSILFSKSQFIGISGDINVRSSTWWSNDITNLNGTLIDSLTTTHGFKQLIFDATHIPSQSMSCIDLIFTNQLKYVTDQSFPNNGKKRGDSPHQWVGESKILLGGFLPGEGNLRGVILTIQTFFKVKNSFLWILNIN